MLLMSTFKNKLKYIGISSRNSDYFRYSLDTNTADTVVLLQKCRGE